MKMQALKTQKLPREIKIDNLTLYIPTLDDCEEMLNVFTENKDHVGIYLNRTLEVDSMPLMKEYIEKIIKSFEENESAHYFLKEDDKIIGMAELITISWKHGKAEYGYFLDKNSTKKGYISKCVNYLDNMLFDMGFERMVIGACTENKSSQNVALRNGYKYEGTERHAYYSFHTNSYIDIMKFSKLNSDF